MDCDRRDVLRAACALPLASVAGCTDFLNGDDRPTYSNDVPEGDEDDEDVFFVHFDTGWLRGYDADDLAYRDEIGDAVDFSFDPETPPVDADVDPLVAYPTVGLWAGSIRVVYGLIPYGFGETVLVSLGDDLDADVDEDDDEAADVDVQSVLVTQAVGVFRGEFEASALVELADDFEETDGRGEFQVFEGTEEGFLGTEGLSFAIRDDVLIATLDETASIDPVLDAHLGESGRLADDDDAAWAFETGGHGHVTVGTWGGDSEPAPDDAGDEEVEGGDVLDGAVGYASSITLEEDEGRGEFAIQYPDGRTPDRERVEEEIGASTTARDVSVSGTRVSVRGEWRAEE